MITAQLVKELRDRTGISMMDCKSALTETDGDVEKAIEVLFQHLHQFLLMQICNPS